MIAGSPFQSRRYSNSYNPSRMCFRFGQEGLKDFAGFGRHLESVVDTVPAHPYQGVVAEHQGGLSPHPGRDLHVDKEILYFSVTRHAQGDESIARPKISYDNGVSNLSRIEMGRPWRMIQGCRPVNRPFFNPEDPIDLIKADFSGGIHNVSKIHNF